MIIFIQANVLEGLPFTAKNYDAAIASYAAHGCFIVLPMIFSCARMIFKTIYGITNCSANGQNMNLGLRRSSSCDKRFLYISAPTADAGPAASALKPT